MTQVTPGNGWLADPSSAPDFAPSPIVLYDQLSARRPAYLFQGDSLVAKLPLEPALSLTANGGALVNQPFPTGAAQGVPLDSPLMTAMFRYANASAVYHQVPDATALDIDGSDSWAFTLCFRTQNNAAPVTAGALMGKRQSTGDLIGWEIVLGVDGSVTLQWKGIDLVAGALGFSTYNSADGQNRYANGEWHTFDVEFDAEASVVRFGNEHEGTMATAWTKSSLSTATTFRIGAVRAFAAGPFNAAYVAASRGPTAMRGDPSTTALDLARRTHLVLTLRHPNEAIT